MMEHALIEADLLRDEGLRLKPYRCPAGKLTIGAGRNLDDVGISKEEALFLLEQDIARVCADLDHEVPWWQTLSANRQRALINMGFNLGIAGLLEFKNMLASLKAGNFNQAAEHALDSLWARQVGDRARRVSTLIREG